MEPTTEHEAMVAAAEAAFEQGDFDRAEELGRLVLRDDLDHLGALRVVGLTCEAQGRNASARLCYKRLADLDPTPENRQKVAALNREKEDVDEALRYYEQTANALDTMRLVLPQFESAETVTPSRLSTEEPVASGPVEAVITNLQSEREINGNTPPTLLFASNFFKTLLVVIALGLLALTLNQLIP